MIISSEIKIIFLTVDGKDLTHHVKQEIALIKCKAEGES